MKDTLNQDNGVPAPTPHIKPKIVLSNAPIKQSIVIDADGNILSSKNPHEAVIISRQDLSN